MDHSDATLDSLTLAQRSALGHFVSMVQNLQAGARGQLNAMLRRVGCTPAMFDAAMESLHQHARVVLHFHPDRIGISPVTVAEALLKEGQYRSQFETGLSSGSATGYPGGIRDDWEKVLFGGAYHSKDARLGERPKYGALELIRYPDGPWPRFGSCYFVLSREVARRTTFTFSGSEQPDAQERPGVINCMDCVLAPLLAELEKGAIAKVPWAPFVAPTLGVKNLTICGLLERLTNELPLPRQDASKGTAGRVLDTGIEAQVHGPIDLRDDVERLVADPAFHGTVTGDCLTELCRTYAITLDWHCGFELEARDVPEGFRGLAVSRLAQRIASDGLVNAAVIGAAQQSLRLQPEEWLDWGPLDETLQHLKQLWHVLVHYGVPVTHTRGTE